MLYSKINRSMIMGLKNNIMTIMFWKLVNNINLISIIKFMICKNIWVL